MTYARDRAVYTGVECIQSQKTTANTRENREHAVRVHCFHRHAQPITTISSLRNPGKHLNTRSALDGVSILMVLVGPFVLGIPYLAWIGKVNTHAPKMKAAFRSVRLM